MSSIGSLPTDPIRTSTPEAQPTHEGISEQIKEDYENIDLLKNMEEAGPAPASSGRARKIIAGIAGALLTAVGIAAATASVLATAGIGLGIMAGVAAFVGGVTGTSIIAGVSGCVGIGLIVGSAKMKVNPQVLESAAQKGGENIVNTDNTSKNTILENLAAQEGSIDAKNVQKSADVKKNIKPLKSLLDTVKDIDSTLQQAKKSAKLFGEKQQKTLEVKLQKMGVDPSSISDNLTDEIDMFVDQIEYDKTAQEYKVDHSMALSLIKDISSVALGLGDDAPATELNQKNVLKVRYAISSFLVTKGSENPEVYGPMVDALNNLEFRKTLSDYFMNEFKKSESGEVYVCEAITLAALFMDDKDISNLPKG